jgi:tetratricopeptide (TPR) repeat protein
MGDSTGVVALNRPIEFLRPLYLDRLSVVVHGPAEDAALYLCDRAWWLGPEHPCAGTVREYLEAAEGPERRSRLRAAVAGLVAWIAARESWTAEPAVPPPTAAGPVPAEPVLMAVAVRERSTEELLAQVGGSEVRLEAVADPSILPGFGETDPHAAFLLSRLERPERVANLIRQMGLARHRTLEILARLHAVGLVQADAPRGVTLAADGLEDVLQRFSQRIAASLEREPLALEAEEHRRQAAELVRSFGGRTHYELLEVAPEVGSEEIQAAYERVARMIHPRHGAALGVPIGLLQLLLRTATEAYLVLCDPIRRAAYDVTVGVETTAARSETERRAAQERHARECYERAVRAVANEQYHEAVEMLREAVRLLPSVEALLLLGNCLARNPNWLRQARDTLQRARQMAPRAVPVVLAAAQLEERIGNLEEAKRLFQSVLELAPKHPEAEAGLARIQHAERKK